MLASDPANMVNQKRPDLGTPNRLKLTSSRSSADRFLLEIAATLMSRHRTDSQSAETSLLIGLLGKLGFSPKERAALNLPTRTT
jgi:hypothetical protein